MADTGNKAGTKAYALSGGYPVDGIEGAGHVGYQVANEADVLTDDIDNSVSVARKGYAVVVRLEETDAGSVTGVVTVSLLGPKLVVGGTEVTQDVNTDPVWKMTITPVASDYVIGPPIMVDGDAYSTFAVYVKNGSGTDLNISVALCPITVPLAS
ncbi:MAG TPA: hypothetical protein VMY35_02795 [Phycisphaerae bacterium]|nr:hypothetical protein [Phycisphaerae bacterium]